jgi:diketogulonate reductase-like aldo/keto reductase
MEQLVAQGGVRVLGASNVNARQIADLVAFATVKPAFVQNRCYAKYGWDRASRQVCTQHGITYQGFSLLTANQKVWTHRDVAAIAKRHAKTPAQIMFRFAQQIGILPLTGTTNPEHMRQDLAIDDVTLTRDELATVERAS